MGVFSFPFNVAADGIGAGDAHRFAGENLFQCPFEVVDFHLGGVAGTIDAAPRIDQFAVLVEDIEVWCPQCTVLQGDILGFVV